MTSNPPLAGPAFTFRKTPKPTVTTIAANNARPLNTVHLTQKLLASRLFLFPRIRLLRHSPTPHFLSWPSAASPYSASKIAPRIPSARKRFLHFLRQFRLNHFIGFAQQPRQLFVTRCVSRLQRHPLRPRQVRRRNNVLSLRQFREVFRRRLKRQTHPCRLERRYRKHFSAHLEQQIVAPLDLFRGSRKRQAQLAQPLCVHPPSLGHLRQNSNVLLRDYADGCAPESAESAGIAGIGRYFEVKGPEESLPAFSLNSVAFTS